MCLNLGLDLRRWATKLWKGVIYLRSQEDNQAPKMWGDSDCFIGKHSGEHILKWN